MPERPTRPFRPTRCEAKDAAWVLLLFLSLPVVAFAPMVLLPLRWLPGGDNWWLVASRIGVVLTVAVAYRVWLDGAARIARKVFAGRLTPELGDWLQREEPPPANPLQAPASQPVLGALRRPGTVRVLGLLPSFRTGKPPIRVCA
jgi:hypothetical protein